MRHEERIDPTMEGVTPITPIRRYSSEPKSQPNDAEGGMIDESVSAKEIQPEPTYVPPAEVRKETVEERKRAWYHPLSLFHLAVDNWFLIGIFVFIILASQFPNVAKSGGHIRSEYSISYAGLAVIFLITGLTLSTPALLSNLGNIYLHVVTQGISLLLFPTTVFVIITIIQASGGGQIDPYITVGYMVMGVMPTTVASNLAMTRTAKGNVEAATAEVCIGQILGIFFSPLLLEMYFLGSSWAYGRPEASGGGTGGRNEGLKEIYRQLGMKMGLALFLPLLVGQVIRHFFPKQTKWTADTFYLAKVASFILLLVIWSAFSNQFAVDAFSEVSAGSIVLTVFLNLILYLLFTALCIYVARPPFFRKSSRPGLKTLIRRMTFDKKSTTAICFCAAAKGLVVAYPLLDILYGGYDARERAIVSIPMVLYQGEQVAVAQLLTYLFRVWNEKPDPYDELKNEGEVQSTLGA